MLARCLPMLPDVRPTELALPFLRHHALFRALYRRELATLYRDSFLGNLWMVITPLLMLLLYTFVFGVIFKARWHGIGGHGIAGYAIVLFAGLLLHTLMADTLGRSPRLMLEQPNYVTKVVFPLQLLGWVNMMSALLHYAVGLVLLLVVVAFALPPVHLAILWLPVILAPYLLYLVGLGWALSAIGVYLRDLSQLMSTVISLLMFLSPVFYARTQAPLGIGKWLILNPLTVPVEQVRRILFQGLAPRWDIMGWYALGSVVVYLLGLTIFQKLRRGFSDVM